MPHPIDITGQRFGRLTPLHTLGMSRQGMEWLCQCDCGELHPAYAKYLRSGHTRSCGCLVTATNNEAWLRHGHKTKKRGASRTYNSWAGMLQRCTNPRSPAFKYYGARGITVCERWQLFENFLADMGECPPGMSIDRINNDLGYSAANCRWATSAEQARNKRQTNKLSKADVLAIRLAIRAATKSQRQLAQDYSISEGTISMIKRGKVWRHL